MRSGRRQAGLRRRSPAPLLLPASFLVIFGAHGAEPGFIAPHDGPAGMTCELYDAALNVRWTPRVPDWIDARGKANGAAPFAARTFDPETVTLEFDVTKALASDARRVPGTLLLRGASPPGGTQVFASREHPDASKRPRLTLRLTSGRLLTIAPDADTVIDCTTSNSLGARSTFAVGPNRSSIVRFALPEGLSGNIESAKLELHPVNASGTGVVSIYALAIPVAPAIPSSDRGIAADYPHDRGLDGLPEILFTEQFESADWARRWSIFDFRSRAERTGDDEQLGFEPLSGHALRVTIAKGATLGLDLRYRLGNRQRAEPEEAYFRYYLRFGDDWGSDVDGGKLPGLSGTYGRAGWGGRDPDGYNGWNMRMSFAPRPPPGHPGRNLTAVGTEAVLPRQRTPAFPENSKPRWPWSNGFKGILEKGRWYCIEQHVQLNTPGKADGQFQAWVDGALAIDRRGLEYRYGKNLRIEEIWLNVYHGGNEPAATEQHLYIDGVVVASRYIGPMAR
jgi:polysaccharide lyase-like protein